MPRMYFFDTDTFITMIQNSPCIWNTKHETYCERNAVKDAWNRLYERFYSHLGLSGEVTPIEKKVKILGLQRRWKSLRDGFNRQLRYENTNPIEAKSKNAYVYFEQLSFLKANKPEAELDSNNSNDLNFEFCNTNNFDLEITNGIKTEFDHEKSQTSGIVKLKNQDEMFLLSLAPYLEKLPEDVKFGLKIEIMQNIQNALNQKQ